ncbi:hypothetical protein CC79DRAFT_1369363 [Sarocladium strictum]|jgi:hypothetical protein
MQFSVVLLAAIAGLASAQNDVQSKPFRLELCSDDKSLNGKGLTACHTGAAIESLCLYDGKGSDFRFNTTKGDTAQAKGYTPSGELIFNLPLSDKSSVSSAMSFSIEASTNVAIPLFMPGDSPAQYVAFDKKSGALRVFSYIDDTKKPVKNTGARALNRWYICSTNYSGYTYKTLSWVYGKDKPQNPSCKKVDVKRKF